VYFFFLNRGVSCMIVGIRSTKEQVKKIYGGRKNDIIFGSCASLLVYFRYFPTMRRKFLDVGLKGF